MNHNVDPNLPEPLSKRIVVIGGGFAGIEFAKKISTKYYQVVLLDKNNYHQFQPLFYQVATAGIEPSAISYPFRKLFQNKKNFHFRVAEVRDVDTVRKTINTSIGPIGYDYLVLAMGAVINFYGNPSLEQNAFKLKSTTDAITLRNAILRKFEEALLAPTKEQRKALLQFAVVGGGPTGVEVCGALSEMKKFILPKDYPEIDFDLMDIYLIEGSDSVLNTMSQASSRKAEEYLNNFGIHIIKSKTVKSFDGDHLELSDQSTLPAKTVIWAAGVKAANINGIDRSIVLSNNRIQIDSYNRAKGYHDVFVLGDLAANDIVLPQVAQVAIQQGANLAKNLNHGINTSKWKKFEYHDLGTMATVGRNKAVAEIFRLKFNGFIAWFIWMFIHLVSIVGAKNRLQTFINWAWKYFTYDQSLRLITNAQKDLDKISNNTILKFEDKPQSVSEVSS